MADTDVRWTVAQRFEFIEWRVYWAGRMNRKDLEDRFQISTQQASIDLRDYQAVAPGNIEYDPTEKTFVVRATRNFRPAFLRLSPERYLIQLHALVTGAVHKRDTWFADIPPVDVTPTIVRGPEAYTLRPVVQAIEARSAVEINYQSLTRTGMRTICPHALVHDGYRWHCRALDVARGEFRDYVLGRILSISQLKPSNADPSDDIEWHTYFKLKLTAHPGLDPRQRETIEHDYRMEDGELQINMRLAVAFYFVKRYSLDLQDKGIEPVRMQLRLSNLSELNAAIAAARERSKLLVAQKTYVIDGQG